jgi:hypothetical protein
MRENERINIMSKYTYDFVKDYIQKTGCVFLDDHYDGSRKKLNILGICKHPYQISFDTFKNRKVYNCRKCGYLRTSEKNKNSYDYVKEYIASFECELLSDVYERVDKKLIIKFKCGHIDSNKTFQTFKSIKQKICSDCSSIKLPFDFVKEYIENCGCKMISDEYYSNNEKIKIIGICGHTYDVSFSGFKRRHQYFCSNCARANAGLKRTLSFDYVKKIIAERGCELLNDEYIGASEPLKILFSCGHIWNRSFTLFKLSNPVCGNCSGTEKIEIEEVKKNFAKIGLKFITDEEYLGNKYKIGLIDNNGYKYYSTYKKLSKSKKENWNLSRFYSSNPYTLDNIKNWLTINNKSFELVSEKYNKAKENLMFRCLICNNIFERSWDNVLQSTGESLITKFLFNNDIEFISEKRFKDCKNIRQLPFDFYIPLLNVALEYQGIQHFSQVDFAGMGEDWAKDQFEQSKKRDQIKREYCKDKNIRLIEIPYWKKDLINDILSDELKLQEKGG